jgi:hypothetical protein
MDLHCTTCGEPYDIECLREPDEYGITVEDSRIVKCSGCEWHRARGFPLKREAEVASAMHDILGDDIDGIASMMEDMGF